MTNKADMEAILSILSTQDIKSLPEQQKARIDLREMGDTALNWLIDLLQDSEETNREKAVVALGWLGDVRSVTHLLRALYDENDQVRNNASWAIRQIRDAHALALLTPALQASETFVRRAVVWALVEIKTSEAASALVNVLTDVDSKVREAAVYGLGKMEDKNALEFLIPMLEDVDEDVRYRVVVALGEIKDIRAIDPLVKTLTDPNLKVATNAIYSISSFDEDAVTKLTIALGNSKGQPRARIVKALALIRSKSAVEPLLETLRDRDETVVRNAIEALGAIGDFRAVNPLIDLFQNSKFEGDVVDALGYLPSDPSVHLLTQALNKDELRERAAASLVHTRNLRAIKPVLHVLDLVGGEILKDLDSLIESEDRPIVIEFLLDVIDEENIYAREFAAEKLGEIRAVEAIEKLKSILQDEDDFVRLSAALALSKIGTKEALDALEFSLNDSNEKIRQVARAIYPNNKE